MILLTKEAGKITGNFRQEIEKMTDGKYHIDIQPLDTRNLQQNAFLWGWTYKYAQIAFSEKGMQLTDNEIHEFFKIQFLRKRKKCKVTKRYRLVEGSTSKLSRKQFSTYIKDIEIYCLQRLDYQIPLHVEIDLLSGNY